MSCILFKSVLDFFSPFFQFMQKIGLFFFFLVHYWGTVIYGDGDQFAGERTTKVTTHIDRIIIDGVSNVEKVLFHTNYDANSSIIFKNGTSEFYDDFKLITGSPVIETNVTFMKDARIEPNYNQGITFFEFRNFSVGKNCHNFIFFSQSSHSSQKSQTDLLL